MSGKSTTLAGVQTLNSHTLRIRLAEPSGSFLSKLANPAAYVVPPWAVEKDPRHWADHAFGTGPFRVTRWIHKNALQLAPNRYFYGGKPKLDGIDMPFFPEPIAAFKRYQIGALHTMGAVRFPTQELYAVSGRADFHPSTRLETVYLTLNERRAPFNNSLVRKAFALAVNKQAIVDQAFGGFANPTDVMLPPGIPGYAQAAQRATYNPAFARKLLAKSGHAGGRGLPEIDYPVDQDAQDALMDSAIVQQWQRVLGVRVRLTKYTHTRYLLLLQKLQYQIAVIDWTADYPDPENFLSQQLHTGSPNNNGGWSNPAFDRLVERADRMPVDRSERYTLYRRAEKIAMQEAAVIPLVNPKAGILLRRDVRGLVISGGYILSGNWAHVTVSPASTQ